MSKFSDATLYLAPSGYKEGILFPQKPLSTNGEISFTRASSAWRTNIEGQVEETCYNLLQQSEDFTNSYWTKSASSITADAITAPNGTLTADKLVENTSNSSHQILSTSATAIVGTNYVSSIYAKAGERNWVLVIYFDGGTVKGRYFDLTNGVGGAYWAGATITNSITSVGDGWYRITLSYSATTTSNILGVYLANSDNNNSYSGNGTSGIYIWGAQLVRGSLPRPYLSTTNRQNFPRVDYSLGTGTFLLEPQRTNGVRNSTMQGTVIGTPGTNPTNWGSVASAGLNQSIVATGIENGLSYVDYRFNGSATSGIVRFFFEGTTTIAAVDGQTWASSVYLKVISGTYDGSSIGFTGRTSAGASAGTTVLPGVTITSTLTRFTAVGALASATVAYVQPQLDIYVTSGLSYDFTIRIAQPQMELGAYVTSPIFTTSSAVTRIADSFSRGNIFTNNLISSSGGTWFVEFKNNLSLTGDGGGDWISLTDSGGTSGNGLRFYNPPSLSRMIIYKIISSAGTPLFTTTTDSVKVVIKWNGFTADVFVNGIKQVSATAFTFTAMQILSSGITAVPKYIQQMALWRTPLTDAQCQEITL